MPPQTALNICEECRQHGGLIPTMEEIAEKAANRVVELHKKDMEIRLHEFKEDFVNDLDERIGARIQGIMGGMKPHEHYDSHQRLDRLLKLLDDLKGSIIRRAVVAVLYVMSGAGMVLLVFWDQIVK